MGVIVRDRLLLCRPRGGLNDMLQQIDACWTYAEQFGRRLMIDTTRSGLWDHFDEYFETARPEPNVKMRLTEADLPALNAMPAHPNCVSGRLDTYQTEFSKALTRHVEAESGTPVTFDFARDHDAPLLVHEQGGGGRHAIFMLPRLRFTADLRAHVNATLARLGGDYWAVHVRNTDYTTDVDAFFSRVGPSFVGRRVLICSDDAAVIKLAHERFHQSTILTATQTPDVQGRPLHESHDLPISRREANYNLLTDLAALGASRKLLTEKPREAKWSGFSRLARGITLRPGLLDTLLERRSLGAARWAAWNHLPTKVRALARALRRPS